MPGAGGDTAAAERGTVRCTLIANAGVLVSYGGTTILIDGVHHADDHPFSAVCREDLDRMRRREEPFTRLDYLLFSHEHSDHFSPACVEQSLLSQPLKALFLPRREGGSAQFHHLLNTLETRTLNHWTLGLPPGRTARFPLGDSLELTVFGARHMGEEYSSICNDCYLLSAGGRNLLFTGDADYVADFFTGPLADIQLDAAFVNPIFFRNGQEVISTILSPRHLVVYHLPFQEEDTIGFGKLAQRLTGRFGPRPWQYHIFNSRRATLTL